MPEQGRPRRPPARPGAALAAALIAVALAGCGRSVTEPEIRVLLSPELAEIPVGGTVQLVAIVEGTANQAVTFESAAPAVASVGPDGRVTGVSTGTAVVTAAAVADPTKRAASTITVLPPQQATVLIRAIRESSTGRQVDPDDTAGSIEIELNLDIPPGAGVDAIEVLVGGELVCRQALGPQPGLAADDFETACVVNTAAFNRVPDEFVPGRPGMVRFANGPTEILARLRRGAETVSSAGTQLRLNNLDAFLGEVQAGNRAADDAGREWHGNGDLGVTAYPILYSGRALGAVTVGFLASTRVAEPEAGVFHAVFPRDAPPGPGGHGVAGVNTGPGGDQPRITSMLATGAQGPAGFVNQDGGVAPFRFVEDGGVRLRLDNEPPEGGTFVLTEQRATPPVALCCSENWVGAAYRFEAGKAGHSDAGVGFHEVTYHAGPAASSDAALAAMPAVVTGADVAETATNAAYRAVAVVRDRLGNGTVVPLQPNAANPLAGASGAVFGVDRTAPVASFDFSSIPNFRIFNAADPPTGELRIVRTDPAGEAGAQSGFGAMPVFARMDRWAPGLSDAERCVLGQFEPDAGCGYAGASATTTAPTADGYYTYEAFVVDRAGNESEPVGRTFLTDQTAPTAGGMVLPQSFTGGEPTTFAADAVDNLNLWTAEVRLRFGDVETLPFRAPTVISPRFPTSLVTTARVEVTFPFVRALEVTGPTHAPSGALQAPVDARLWLRDAAGGFFERVNTFGAGAVPAGESFVAGGRNVVTFRVVSPEAPRQVCNGSADCVESVATSVALTAAATGATGTFANPFAAVHFYRRDVGGVARFIGAAGSPSASDDGTTRTWTYGLTFTPAGLPPQANVPIFAVGVHSSGDALRTVSNANVSIVATP